MRRILAWPTVLLLVAGCRSPTQITLELTTDLECEDGVNTGIAVGSRDVVELGFNATTTACDSAMLADGDGRIGSIVAVPSDEHDAEVSFKVVAQLGLDVGEPSCTEDAASQTITPDCVVARRALRFIDHTPLRLPVRLSRACLGRYCVPGTTCLDGSCVNVGIEDCAAVGGEQVCSPPPPPPPTTTLGWTRLVTGADTVEIADVAIDAQGNVYFAGNYSGSGAQSAGIQLEPSAAEDRAFLASFDAKGNHRWTQTSDFSTSAGTHVSALSLASDGRLWVATRFVGAFLGFDAQLDHDSAFVAFDGQTGDLSEAPLAPVSGGGDQNIPAFDIDGDRLWAAVEFEQGVVWPGATSSYVPNGAAASDDVLLAGVVGVGGSQLTTIPATLLGGGGKTWAVAMARSGAYLHVVGHYDGSIGSSMLPTGTQLPPSSSTGTNGYIARVNGDTGGESQLFPIVADDVKLAGISANGGEVCMGGDYQGLLRVGTGSNASEPSNGSYDVWVACIDSDGLPSHTVSFGDAAQQHAHHVGDGVSDDVLMTGDFTGTLQLGPITYVHPDGEAGATPFVASLRRSDLVPRWSRRLEGAYGVVIRGAAAASVDGHELVVIVGHHARGAPNSGSFDLEGTEVPLDEPIGFVTMLIDP